MFPNPETKRKPYQDFSPDKYSTLQMGIDRQRECFKMANLRSDFDIMVKCLENIKTEIKSKAIAKGKIKEMQTVEKVLSWYKELPFRYKKKTPQGYTIKYPASLNIKINKYLNRAYEILVEQLHILELI